MAARRSLVATAYVRDGKLRLARQDLFLAAVREFPNCKAVLRTEEHKDPRSQAMLGYYWAGLIKPIHLETGFSEFETHTLMKQLHLSRADVAMRGRGRIVGAHVLDGTTTNLSGEEQWLYHERIHQWSAETLGLPLRDPNSGDVVAA